MDGNIFRKHVVSNRQQLIDGIDVNLVLTYYSINMDKMYMYVAISKFVVLVSTMLELSTPQIKILIQSTAEEIIDEWISSNEIDNHPIITAVILTGQLHLLKYIYPPYIYALAA